MLIPWMFFLTTHVNEPTDTCFTEIIPDVYIHFMNVSSDLILPGLLLHYLVRPLVSIFQAKHILAAL